MRKILVPTLIIIFTFICSAALFLGVLLWSFTPRQYSTDNVEEYGKYIGNYNNDIPCEFITSFFPECIDTTFVDVIYSYRAQKGDTYAYEAYLEFVIEDAELYESFIQQKTAQWASKPFLYDSTFTEYTVSDVFEPTNLNGNINMNTPVSIRYAKIGKILCSKEEQRIIFVALGVYDGGIAKTDFLTVYFNRFEIDPASYKGAAIR